MMPAAAWARAVSIRLLTPKPCWSSASERFALASRASCRIWSERKESRGGAPRSGCTACAWTILPAMAPAKSFNWLKSDFRKHHFTLGL
ncbi:hypothetical protein D9M69_645670 [compost metagenome]